MRVERETFFVHRNISLYPEYRLKNVKLVETSKSIEFIVCAPKKPQNK